MHDVIVLYKHPADPAAFDAHYRQTHVPLVDKLPELREFAWGHVTDADRQADTYLVARMTYADADAAAQSMASPAGEAAVDDLANFAGAGATVLNVTRDGA